MSQAEIAVGPELGRRALRSLDLCAYACLASLAALLVVGVLAVLVVGSQTRHAIAPPLLGNSADNIRRATTATDPDNFTFVVPNVIARPLPGTDQFLRLARTLPVHYVFAGDHHGYWTGRRGATTYTITGGGGAKLRGDHGRFHHMVRVAVEGSEVTQSVVAVPRRPEWPERLEHHLAVHVWPLVARGKASVAATVAVALLAAFVLHLSLKRVGALRWGCQRHAARATRG